MEMQMVQTLRSLGACTHKNFLKLQHLHWNLQLKQRFWLQCNKNCERCKREEYWLSEWACLKKWVILCYKKLLGCLNVRGERPERETKHVLFCLSHETSNITTPSCYNFLSEMIPKGRWLIINIIIYLGDLHLAKITFFAQNQSQITPRITK